MDGGMNLLLNRLCELHIGNHEAPQVAQPKYSRREKLRITRIKSWNVLFSFLNGPHRKQDAKSTSKSALSEIDQINALAFDLRQQRKFDEANCLEEQLGALLDAGVTGSLKRVLKFLIRLSDVSKESESEVVGHCPRKLPIIFPRKTLPRILPPGPLCHGDTRLQRKDDPFYIHFPSELFEVPGVCADVLQDSVYDALDTTIFCTEPGKNLCGHGVFNIKGNLDDAYEKRTRNSLFGALTHSLTSTNDILLDLPDIQDTWNTHILELKPPSFQELSNDDEGFVDRTPSSDGSLDFSNSALYGTDVCEEEEEDIWDLALKGKPCHHYTWELRGQLAQVKERPYLSEAGIEVFDDLYLCYQKQLRLLDPSIAKDLRIKVSMYQLVKDTLNMLIGVPSDIFILEEDFFTLVPNVYTPGLTPEGLAASLSDLLACGSQYVKLVNFSKPPIMDSMYQAGLVFQAFTGGVRKYLQHYRACVLSLPKDKTLLQLSVLFEKLREQMRVLAQLCWCEENDAEEQSEFPTGVDLLSYLYDNTLESSASCHYPMLLSLLHTSCGPYIVFVREWVFYGNVRDVYGEFLIQVNEDYLRFRDRSYWTYGYEHVAKNLDESVPLFLKDMANEIFVCGKAINLLRLICPGHFLFSLEGETPSVSMTFSETELSSIQHQVQVYVGRMKEIARQHAKNRATMIAEAENIKQAVLVKARATALQQVIKYQERAEKVKKKVDEKKRAAFAELKEQMEKDLRRRATEKEQEKEEDAARVAMVTRQELLEAAVEEEIAVKAREELVEEYALMTAQAAARERRALWKVARHRLELRRIEFLTQDEGKWQAELFDKPMVHQFDDDVLDEVVSTMVSETERESIGGIENDVGIGIGVQVAMPGTDVLADLRGEPGTTTLPTWATRTMGDAQTLPDQRDDDSSSLNYAPDTTTVNIGSDPQMDAELVMDEKSMSKLSINATMTAGENEPQPELPKWAQSDNEMSATVFGLVELDPSKAPKLACEAAGSTSADSTSPQSESEGILNQPDSRPATETYDRVDAKHWHVSQQTDMTTNEYKPGIKGSASVSATTESISERDVVPHKKTVHGRSVNAETTESQTVRSTRGNALMSCTEESTLESDLVSRRKLVTGQFVNRETKQQEQRTLIKIDSKHHPSVESKALLPKRPQRNMFGHPSQMSMISNYEIIAPVFKSLPESLGFSDVDFGCYQIKPKRRRGPIDDPDGRQGVGMNRHMYATKESEYIDYNKQRLDKFKAMNIHGHSSDSSVQRLLYGEDFGRRKLVKAESIHETHEEYNEEPWTDIQLEEYCKDFNMLNETPVVDLMNSMLSGAFTDWNDYGISTSPDISAYSYVSLSALLKRAVVAPLSAQIQLVNQSLVNYYFAELKIESHFVALRRFLLMQDGEFGQSLSEQLFEKLALCPLPYEIFNPMFLNNVLSRALRSSLHGDSEWAGNVGFAFQYIPPVLEHHAPKALECLELTYNVEWPVNIVITMTALSKYSRVFSFMLQLKRAVWVLKDVWHRLKRDAIINNASTSSQFRKLQLYRHEMQHFVKVMQGYIANQVIHVTWQEFQEDLSNKTHSIDDLHRCHTEYLNKCISRCLLNKKAAPVMKIIEEIFEVILKFRTHLISHEWHYDGEDGITHPAYDNMCNIYKVFKEYARFLFKVVNRLALRGYQPHLQELLLRLNYNSYYSDQ